MKEVPRSEKNRSPEADPKRLLRKLAGLVLPTTLLRYSK
jgi:hypothetical protein